MSRGGWIWGTLGLVVASLLPGCGAMGRHREPANPPTGALLDVGPTPRVTARQAGEVQFALGRTAEEADQLDQAAAAYRAALGQSPKQAETEHRLAVVLDRQGKTAEADEHFGRALKLAPKDPEILCDRGYSYHVRGRSTEAERSLRAALALQGDHARSHTNLGLVLASRGQADLALEEFHRAGVSPAEARANLALGLALGGHLDEANAQYAQTPTDQPRSALVRAGQRGVASALKARSESARQGLPPLPGAEGPMVATASGAGTATLVDPAVRPASVGAVR